MNKSQDTESAPNTLPTHLGFIVDGNRRWARERNLPTLEGHRRGIKKVEMVAEELIDKGVKFVSFYVFSTENWNRKPEEVAYLMDLFRVSSLRLAKKCLKKNFKCVVLGGTDRVAPDLLEKWREAEEMTKDCTAGTIAICFNYGGKQEIAEAAKKVAEQNEEFTPENLEKHLYCPEIPPCDMIIRTSGEQRISNFLLWRAAYAEFLFLKKNFPAITKLDLEKILTEYTNRHRRFGV